MCLKWKAGGGVIGVIVVIVVIYLLIFLTAFYLFIYLKKALNKICTLISLCKYFVFNPMTNKDSNSIRDL